MKPSAVVYKFIFACVLSLAMQSVFAKPNFHTYNVVLLQPDSVMQQRVPDVDTLATYIKSIQKAMSVTIEPIPRMEVAGGFIVVAVKPGNKSQVWLDFKSGISPRTASVIKSAVATLKPANVTGLIVFALKVGLNGGPEPIQTSPSPEEWKAAGEKAGHAMEVSSLVESIWPD